jgi:hypothetical protein
MTGRCFRHPRSNEVIGSAHIEVPYQTFPNPPRGKLEPQLIETIPLERAMRARPLTRQGRAPAKLTSLLQYPTLLMAEAKPLWYALYHSVTLTETEDYEYRRSSIYKNIDAKYRINNDG